MNSKPKVAFYWCASCGGCEETILDLAEDVLGVLDAVDIVLWPVAMDFKKRDIEVLAEREIAVSFVNGAIRTSEQEEMAALLRRKSRYVVAYGACAQLGGIPALANMLDREAILKRVYDEDQAGVAGTGATGGEATSLGSARFESSPGTAATTLGLERDAGRRTGEVVRPQTSSWSNGHMLTLPTFREGVRVLDQVIAVDYYVPGCPPTPKLTRNAINVLLSDHLPPTGTVLAPDVALCDECPRKASKPADLSFQVFHRPHTVALDPTRCLLAQGVVCMGPATRAGCEAACVAGNMPCTGCFGPSSRGRDQGAKMLSSLCGAIEAKEADSIAGVLEGIPDPIGTFYRYGLARSLLRRRMATPPTPPPSDAALVSPLRAPAATPAIP